MPHSLFRHLVPGVLAAFVATPPLLAQEPASPYVPLDHWAMPHVEHLITAGVIADPAPLTRPIRRADLVRVLVAVDTATVGRAVGRTVGRLLREFDVEREGPYAYGEAHLGISAATHALRDPLGTRCRPLGGGACATRDPDPSHGFVDGGLALRAAFGPVVAVTHPYFDTRLKRDPDYFGKIDRVIAGRNAEAYLSAQWKFGELFFGTLDRNWGPPFVQGLLVSPSPYGYDHLAVTLGTGAVRLEGLVTQLDDYVDTAGAVHRYFVAHRLVLRPSNRLTIGLWEGTLLAGGGRQPEPWYLNLLNLGLLAQYNEKTLANNQLGVDVAVRLGGVRALGQFLLDDIQVDRSTAGDREPPSYGVTLGMQGAAAHRGVAWTAFYTRVTNLAYRTPDPAETVQRRFVGLARAFSDYDQVTLRATTLLGPGLLVGPELTLLRQGEGDFREPYPPVTAFDSTPTIFAGVRERTVRLALAGSAALGSGVRVRFDVGVHRQSNADHVGGQSRTRFVGAVSLAYHLQCTKELP